MEQQNLFAPGSVNRGRQLELDLVRGLAILFMLLVHCHEMFSVYPFEPTWSTYVIRFLGSPPAAPVFMFALGVGVAYTRKNTAKELARRGLQLFILSYVFTFCRDFVTQFLVYLRTKDPFMLEEAVTYLFGVDILTFAGLTFLFFAAGAKLRFRSVHYAAAALICAALNLLLARVTVTAPALYRFTDLIWGTSEYTWFPFLTWIPFPISGYLFGQLLLLCLDKNRFYRSCLWVSVPGMLALGLFSWLQGLDYGWGDGLWETAYFHHNLVGNLLLLSFVLSWLAAFYFLSPRLPRFVVTTLCRWSRNITEMYWIHWMIIVYTWVFLRDPWPLPWILAFFVVLVPATDYLASTYLSLKVRLQPPKAAGGSAA